MPACGIVKGAAWAGRPVFVVVGIVKGAGKPDE
jgi:hypothetical protein